MITAFSDCLACAGITCCVGALPIAAVDNTTGVWVFLAGLVATLLATVTDLVLKPRRI